LKLKVICETGGGGEPEPIAFEMGARRIEVVRIVDRWPDARCRYYKVETSDGAVYILRFDEHSRHWEITWFSASG